MKLPACELSVPAIASGTAHQALKPATQMLPRRWAIIQHPNWRAWSCYDQVFPCRQPARVFDTQLVRLRERVRAFRLTARYVVAATMSVT